jgi:integral membrane protein
MTIQNFRYVAVIEATSWLILLIATILKYGAGGPDLAPILGPIHGLLFVAYVLMALTLRPTAGWDGRTTILILVCAVVPLGGYYADRALIRESQVA